MEPVRRVVTGHDEHGKAVFTEDDAVEPVTLSLLPGFESIELWHTDTEPAMDGGLGAPGVPHYFPPAGGSVFRVVTFPPEVGGSLPPDFDFEASMDEAVAKMPDLVARLEHDDPGMHATESVDFGVVIEGELDLELDDGATRTLRPGTVVVQRGTRHAWRNRSDRPARVAFVLLGARPGA